MGLGFWTSEEIKHDAGTGELLTKNTWEYKPPASKDIPQDFRVSLKKNSRNPAGVVGSKGNFILKGCNNMSKNSMFQQLENHQ